MCRMYTKIEKNRRTFDTEYIQSLLSSHHSVKLEKTKEEQKNRWASGC